MISAAEHGSLTISISFEAHIAARGEVNGLKCRIRLAPDSSMRATRANVIAVTAISVSPGQNWIFDGRPPIVGAYTTAAAEKLQSLLAPYESTLDSHGHEHVAMTVNDLLEIRRRCLLSSIRARRQ